MRSSSLTADSVNLGTAAMHNSNQQDRSQLRSAPTVGVLSQKDMTFIVSPPEIKFQAFEPHKRYESILTFKNQTKTAKYIRLLRPENPFFSISEPRGGANTLKVAAGLSITYSVYFTPQEDIDYDCDLVAVTDAEKFLVPVRAIASRGQLALPAQVVFDAAPIKCTSTTTVFVTNIGKKPCEWQAVPSPPFKVEPPFGRIEVGGNMQIQVLYCPMELQRHSGQIVFEIGHPGEHQTMNVVGEAVDVANIALDMDQIIIPKTFISLERQGVVQLVNNSDHTVNYCWKAHRTTEEETMALEQRTLFLGGHTGDGEKDENAQDVGGPLSTPLEVNRYLFDDDVFTIHPAEGSIVAKGTRQFTVTFNPQLAMSYCAVAFLDVEGRTDRLPLTLKGVGLGPQCVLPNDSIDLGDIFINSLRQYDISLENRGSIEAKWAVLPQKTLFGPTFKIVPSSGSIAPGREQKIQISFCSDMIGILSETFKIHVQGSRETLQLHFKGRVIGPTFHFDVEELDFGNVSYNFWHVKNFSLVNTSEIPMQFRLRVPEDQPTRKEFDVIPASGTILPTGKQKIQVDFLSNTVQEYNAHLVVDIDTVGENLDSLPIKATCIVPEVTYSKDALDYGQGGTCYIGHPYTQDIDIRNDTALAAKYEFVLPAKDDPIRKKAEVKIGSGDPKEQKGVVQPRSTTKISVTLTPKMVGSVHLPIYIRILGSEKAPHHVAISAKVTGPTVRIEPSTLDFSTTEVLTEVSKPIVIANNSPIPATFRARLTAKHPSNVIPPFSLKTCEGTIQPQSTAPLHVTAYLDEAMKFTDDLVVEILHNQEPITVHVSATGKGYTLVPSIPIELIDFADQFTTIPVKRTFTLYNKGRRPQQIQWVNERGKLKEGEAPIVFSITPERATINGKSEENFTLEGLSAAKGVFAERFVCKLSQSHKTVFRSTVQGSFQNPLLSYSTNSVPFSYMYSPTEAATNFLTYKPITMKNISALDLEFSLKVVRAVSGTEPSPPFTLDQQEFSLKRGESAVVNVGFDAAYKGDRVSHKTTAKLVISFANHSQKDTVALSAEVQYPNLALDGTSIDFGCILNDTEQRKTLILSNTSQVPATYTWVFEDDGTGAVDGAETSGSLAPLGGKKKPPPPSLSGTLTAAQLLQQPAGGSVPAVVSNEIIPINNVFDVIPFRGVIAPGTTERVEVLFCGIPGRKFSATAVCQVEGGPDYPLQLLGEASSIHYKFDRVALEFAPQEYDKWEEKEIVLTNNARVPFAFQVDLSMMQRPGMVEVVPMNGTVKDKQFKLLIRFSPRIPDRVNDYFKIQIAHFEPQIIQVRGMGLYSSVAITATAPPTSYVSRNDPPSFKQLLLEAKAKFADPQHKPYAPPTPGAGSFKSGSRGGGGSDAQSDLVDPILTEAERLYFCGMITDDAMMLKQVAAGEAVEQEERAKQIKRKMPSGDTKYILSRYVINLGNIIRGDTKKKSFKIINTSASNLTLVVDRKAMQNAGITFAPDKFTKLSPYQAQIVDVTLNTKGRPAIGEYSSEVIVDIRGGPLVLIEIRAFIIVPELEVSCDKLEFGNVYVGMTRTITFSLTNHQALPAEWHVAQPENEQARLPLSKKNKLDKRGQFIFKPDRGILMAHQAVPIEVSFIPATNESLTEKVQLRIAAGNKPVDLVCSGSGEEVNLEVNPAALELPAVFPFEVATKTFQLCNKSAVPIEVFSYDFDTKYVVEEEILRNAPEHFSNNVLLLPPRPVGSSLPDFLMESYFEKLTATDGKLATADVVSVEAEKIPAPPVEEKPPVISPSIPLPPLTPIGKPVVEVAPIKPSIIIITGPPLSGKSSLVEKICSTYPIPQIRLDTIFSSIAELDTADGSFLRTVLSKLHDNPHQPGTASPPVANSPPSTPAAANQGQQPPAQPQSNGLTPTILANMLTPRLKLLNLSMGFVVDDLATVLTNNCELVLLAMKEIAAALGLPLNFISLGINEVTIKLRKSTVDLAKCKDDLARSEVKPLSEEVYDRLSFTEKKENDVSLKKYRDCKKALGVAQQSVNALLHQRKEKDEKGTLISVQQQAVQEAQAAKDAEDAQQTKGKPSKAPPKKGAVAETPPPIPWDDLDGVQRQKKLFLLSKGILDENANRLLSAEKELDETGEKLFEVLNFPKPNASPPPPLSNRKSSSDQGAGGGSTTARSAAANQQPSATPQPTSISPPMISARPGSGGVGSEGGAALPCPEPQTFLRVEYPPPKKERPPLKFYKLLTKVVQVVKETPSAAPSGAPPGKKPPGKGAAPPPPPVVESKVVESMEELTRWIIEPNSNVEITLQFCSDENENHACTMNFGVVGCGYKEFPLQVKVPTAYPELIRDPKFIFNKKVRSQENEKKVIQRMYVLQRKRYEFGPLLIVPAPIHAIPSTPPVKGTKPDPKGKGEKAPPPVDVSKIAAVLQNTAYNSDKIKFTNCGLFSADVQLLFENEKEKTFTVSPDSFTLAVNDTIEVTLKAVPEIAGELKNVLVACIADNPEPLKFEVSCAGCRPSLTIDAKKECSVDFGRLMLRKFEDKTLLLKNENLLPLKWSLIGVEKLPPEIKCDVTSGTLDVGASISMKITFGAERASAFNIPLKIEVTDTDGVATYEVIPVNVKAEAHDVVIEWTKEMDFKTIRVGETKKEVIKMMNKGPYDVLFQLRLPKKLQELITVTPPEGTLRGMTGFKDAQVITVEVCFKSTNKEATLSKKIGGIEASFIEPTAKELAYPIQIIALRGEALFNKYQIKPSHINFGPCMNRVKKQASFDIANTGVFDIKYKLFSFKDGLAKLLEPPVEAVPAGKKPPPKAKGKDAKDDSGNELKLGPYFLINNPVGVIPVAKSVTITVSILPEGSCNCSEVLGIHIEDRDPTVLPGGIPFELEAESCVPGIVADLDAPESDSIFEEQQIVGRLDPAKRTGSAFAREERVFSFGIVLAGRRVAERLRLTNPFKVPCNVSCTIVPRGDAADAKQAAEAFDLQNTKVDGGKLIIPPHEHRYITVGFTPNNLNSYSAFFDAIVENGLDAKTRQLRFELRGEGCLPNVALEVPPPPAKPLDLSAPVEASPAPKSKPKPGGKAAKEAPKEEDKHPPNTLVMPRTIMGSSCSRAITVRNVGDITATVRFSLPSSLNVGFNFPHRNEDITLLPGAFERFSVFFEPSKIGECVGKLTMSVQDNRYEDTIINLVGEGYFEALRFAKVDDNTENRITLGDCYLNQPKKHVVQLMSHSPHPLRFKWTQLNPALQISPSVGHLQPGTSKDICITFQGKAPATETVKCGLSYQAFNYSGGSDTPRISDWDDTATLGKWIPDSEATGESPGRSDEDSISTVSLQRRPLKRIFEPIPEPPITPITDAPNASGSKDLFVSYLCDNTQWDVSYPDDINVAKSIEFRKTKVLQQRSTSFLVKNIGKIGLPYSFKFVSPIREPLVENGQAPVFDIKPSEGVITAGQNQTFTVSYRPLDVGEARQLLLGSFPFGAKPELALPVGGESECPLVHFEIPQTDYLLSRDSDLCSLDPNTCVVEFYSKGIRARNTVRFMVLNPTNLGYEFEWRCLSQGQQQTQPFKCNTLKGVIHSGKKFEMNFEFMPDTLKLRESQWTFNIVGQLPIPFLLVGHAMEPSVHFNQTKVQFGQIIVGAKAKQIILIENSDSVPYPFTFEKPPAGCPVSWSPLSGVVEPQSTTPIEILFQPTSEEACNVTIQCKVRRAVVPMTCNVKGEGYTTHDSMRMSTLEGVATPVNPGNTPNTFNLGSVQVNGKIVRRFVLTNQGKFAFDYRWTMSPHPHIQFTDMIGSVAPNSFKTVELTYQPTRESSLPEYKLSCKITNGNIFNIVLNATAGNPLVHLSWKELDFGPVFLPIVGGDPEVKTLTIANNDRQPVAIDAKLDPNDHLEVDVTTFVLQPQEKRVVKLTFCPKEGIQYQDNLVFSINDLTSIATVVRGEGTLPKIELPNRNVRFGILHVGEKKEVELRLSCKSKIQTPVSFENCLGAELQRLGVTISPMELVLKPKETRVVTFCLRPATRMRPFSCDMKMLVCKNEQPFVNVSGACQGSEVHLDVKQLSFGQVVIGTRVSKRITIMNTGDLDMNFSWNEKRLAPDFTIAPLTGTVISHGEQLCEVTYHPTEPGKSGNRENIELRFDEAPSLSLGIVSTQCVDRPSLTDVLTFNCRAREQSVNKISVKNETPDTWTLQPTVDNPVFSAPESLVVRPRESADYSVTYSPQVCTKNRPDKANDSGTLFIPLPTGTALLYRLEGSSEPPSVAGPPIEREVIAKVQHTEKLVVSNWLKVPQRFNANMNWSHDPNDASIVIKGVSTIDVPPNATREYRFTVQSYKEGKITGTVQFTNEETKEYQFYNLTFNVKPPKESGTIQLRTPVRVRVKQEITILNPLSKSVTLAIKSDNPELMFPTSVVAQSKTSATLPVEFFPLVTKEYPPAKLSVSCPELGDFPYIVQMSAQAPAPERPVRVQCALGQFVSTTLRFLHFCKAAAEFQVKFSDPKQTAFSKSSGPAPVKVTPCGDTKLGQEVAVDILFEPAKVGEYRETLEIVSPVAGSYIFPLQGTCTPPARQGPIELRPNQTTQIPFKNVFNENITFSFATDCPQFTLAKTSEAIQAKKSTSVAVLYKCEDPNSVARGKLTITGTSAADPTTPISWIFYLRGMKESEAQEKAAAAPPPPAKGKK